MYKKCTFYLSIAALMAPLVAAEPLAVPSSPLQLTLEQLPTACAALPVSLDAPAQTLLQAFYGARQFTPAWAAQGQLEALLAQLEQLADDGLDPASYPLASLRAFARQPQAVCGELLASHVYLQALQHLLRGRLDQAQVEPLWHAQEPLRASHATLLALAVQGLADLPAAFQQARPALAQYQNLRSAYAQVRQRPLADWGVLAAGPLLRPDSHDARVPALAQRLVSEGYLALDGRPLDDLYNAQEVEAVKVFQQRHALQADGIVGAATLAALNISAGARREQLRVNLERFRWLAQDLERTGLLVNVAAAQLTYYQDGVPQWQTRTQVGRPERPTPLLKSRVTRFTLNPTWSVPPTILREDKLPEIRRDLQFLAKHEMRVLDREGKQLAPESIDWYNPGAIQLRQDAGPKNPLGQLALRFPNPFSVYLHDTPSQQLFSKAPRAFSSGCVRVEGALQLGGLLLSPAEHERALTLLASGATHEFRLASPTPILLSYWTAEVDEHGQLRYLPDIYSRDDALLAALQAARL